jgi:C1A family cysteine protease
MDNPFKKKKKRRYCAKTNKTESSDLFYKPTQLDYKIKKLSLVDKLVSDQQPYDQGEIGSCTSNAIAFLYVFDELRQNNNDKFMPSRLFIYYNCRKLFGDVASDSGISIRDGIKSIVELGVCQEKLWPYNELKVLEAPLNICYEQGQRCKALKYARVKQILNDLKSALSNCYPIAFCFRVFKYFESKEMKNKFILKMPAVDEKSKGTHAAVLVGYDDINKLFKVRNSWGTSWGNNGYFYAPYDFIIDKKYCRDFWIINTITDPDIVPNVEAVELAPVISSLKSVAPLNTSLMTIEKEESNDLGETPMHSFEQSNDVDDIISDNEWSDNETNEWNSSESDDDKN